jgi:4'-phosphopantetheinyl transferase
VGRAALRSILARYVGSAPTELRFVYGDHGKPDLAGQSGPDALRFNLAHSAGLAVAALARGRAVGIDLERIAARGSLMRIAERFFTWREDLAIKALPEAQRTRAFFTCWTRKEAYIKALGDGLAIALNRFEVPVLPDQAPFVRTLIELSPPAIRCSMIDLSVAPDYTAALAVEGSGWAASCWRFAISK